MPTSLRAIAEKASTTGPVRKRTVLKSPVRENCTPGSVRGGSGNWPTYLDGRLEHMHPILAMGDIAGPVLFLSLLISDGILCVAIGLFALSLWKRSLVAILIACIFVVLASFIGITYFPL